VATATLTEIRRLGPENAGELVSAEEFATLEFVPPFRYERVKGRLVVMPPAGPDHRGTSRPFRRELGGYWNTYRDVVDDIDVKGWVATSDDDDRIPDICVYLNGPNSGPKVPKRVPDLIFEVVSGSRLDQERDYSTIALASRST
jgi:Uma2 family endonuclease